MDCQWSWWCRMHLWCIDKLRPSSMLFVLGHNNKFQYIKWICYFLIYVNFFAVLGLQILEHHNSLPKISQIQFSWTSADNVHNWYVWQILCYIWIMDTLVTRIFIPRCLIHNERLRYNRLVGVHNLHIWQTLCYIWIISNFLVRLLIQRFVIHKKFQRISRIYYLHNSYICLILYYIWIIYTLLTPLTIRFA